MGKDFIAVPQVIAQTSSDFFTECERGSACEERSLQLRARPFKDNGVVVMVHRPISKMTRAHAELQCALAELAHLKTQLQAENLCLQEEIKRAFDFEGLVGNSDEPRRPFRKIEQVAATDATVLFLGKTGTGKELHARSIVVPRKEHPLV